MKRSAADERFSSGNEPKIARVSSLQYLAKRALPEGVEVPEVVQYSAGVAAMGRPDPIVTEHDFIPKRYPQKERHTENNIAYEIRAANPWGDFPPFRAQYMRYELMPELAVFPYYVPTHYSWPGGWEPPQ